MLEARTLNTSAMDKAEALMQLHRSDIVLAITNHGQKLSEA